MLGVDRNTVPHRNAAGTAVPAVVTYDATTHTAARIPGSDRAGGHYVLHRPAGPGTSASRGLTGPLTTTSSSFTTGA